MLALFLLFPSNLVAEEPGPNELQIGLGFGPSWQKSQLENRVRDIYVFSGLISGGAGYASDWNYGDQGHQNFRMTYLRNEWLVQLDADGLNASPSFIDGIQAPFQSGTLARIDQNKGELTLNRSGLFAGYNLLHGNADYSAYWLIGFRGTGENYTYDQTTLTGVNTGAIAVSIPGIARENQLDTTAGAVYTGFQFTFKAEPFRVGLRLALESGGGDWDRTNLLYNGDASFEFRREIGTVAIVGTELALSLEYDLNQDWFAFVELQQNRLYVETSEVIPIVLKTNPPTSEQYLQDFLLTYGGSAYDGSSATLTLGLTWRYHFW
ncbi:MAG: hypothetical protein KDK33_08715 [Leptospiraceae bacterium]|nr:hypothetical protein [Leptospiraceae bacterium]